MNCKLHMIFTHLSTTQWLNHWLMFFFFYKGNWLGQMCTLVPGVIMNCKLHTIFTHLSTTQWLNHWLMFFFFYKGNQFGQTSTLVPGVIMNCKPHTIFTHLSTTQTKSLIDVFFSLTKMTGSDRRALLSQEWSWTVSHIRYLHTLQLHRLNHWLMFFFLLQRWPAQTDEHSCPRSDHEL